MKRDDAGYTLTEMLVVIAIISLLAAVLAPALIGQLGRARAKTAQLQIQTISSSLEAFRSDVDRYPTQAEGLKALVQNPNDAPGWLGPYVRDAKSLNDPWGHAIQYSYDATAERFDIMSFGSDGKPGGEGTAADIHGR